MKNKFLVLITFLMAFAVSAPTFAFAAEEAATSASDVKADESKADDVKAADVKAADVKADPAVIETGEQATGVLRQLLDAARSGKWNAVVALAIMLLVFLLNRVPMISAKLGSKAKPWVAAGTGIAGYIAAALLMDNTTLVDAVTGGFMTGASAIGLWEMVFKHFLKPDTGSGTATASA